MTGIINYFLEKINLQLMWLIPRPSIRFIKGKFWREALVGAEVGVWKGKNAKGILKLLSISKLYLIDSYELHDDCKLTIEGGEGELTAKKRLKKWSNKLIWIKKLSSNAFNNLPNNLDFIYIDADHNYKTVIQDMGNYFPKVREGGVLAGHDIHMEGVTKAFIEFVTKHNLKPYIYGEDWWVVKGETLEKNDG